MTPKAPRNVHPFEPGSVPEGTADEIFRYATFHAVTLKDAENDARSRYVPGDYSTHNNRVFASMLEYKSHTYHLMYPFRYAFETRTYREAQTARRRVEQCEARFMD